MLFSRLAPLLAGVMLVGGCARSDFFQPDARPPATASAPLPAAADSVRRLTAGRHYARHGGLYQALVGRHHRASWAAPVSAPVLNLDRAVPGGLRPGKLGGGFNSTSLSLMAPDGRQYVLRSLDKDPSKAMPRWLRPTFLTNALRDNISATNPYAALTVPPLAAALGVPHTRPRLFYVRADDPVFASDSLVRLRGQLGLLEQKFSGPAVAVPGLGTMAVVSSTEAFGQVFANSTHQFDQPALLRARLLDAWLGDWDRHEGQWNWAARPAAAGGAVRYEAIPKDRDMVFYRLNDGVLGWLVSRIRPSWNTFAPRFTNVRGLLHNGHYLDVRALNQLGRPQFAATARRMQQQLPDSLLQNALRRLPPAVQTLEGPRLLATLQARRAALPAFATSFYRELARRPLVGGTTQAERFEVLRYADSTVVIVRPLPADVPSGSSRAAPAPQFRRTFLARETRVIQLEGLGGNDVFVVRDSTGGRRAGRPRLRIYGGAGQDEWQGPAAGRGVRFRPVAAPAKRAYDQAPTD